MSRFVTDVEFQDWAERWTRDCYRLAARRGLRHGRILSDRELALRSLARRFKSVQAKRSRVHDLL